MFTRKVKVIELDKSAGGNIIHYRDKLGNEYYLNTINGRITDADGVGENIELEVVNDFFDNTATIA